MVYIESIQYTFQNPNIKRVFMKPQDIQRLISYDQGSLETNNSYLERIPTTLRYPNITKATLASFTESIQRSILTPIDLKTWEHIALFLIEPDWLQSGSRKQLRNELVGTLNDHPKFLLNILEQYRNVDAFHEQIYTQEKMLFTTTACIRLVKDCPDSPEVKHAMIQHKNTLLNAIQSDPTTWSATIKGADWLIEEIQEEEGDLFVYLNEISLVKIPQQPIDVVQQAMDMWFEDKSLDEVHEIRQNMTQFTEILKDVISDIKNHNSSK